VRAILRGAPVMDATFLLSCVGLDICLPTAKVNKQNMFGSHDLLAHRALPGNLEGLQGTDVNRWYVLEWVSLQRESRKTGSQGREDFLAFDAGEVGT
jgi:hypothetical protein